MCIRGRLVGLAAFSELTLGPDEDDLASARRPPLGVVQDEHGPPQHPADEHHAFCPNMCQHRQGSALFDFRLGMNLCFLTNQTRP